MPQFLSQLNYSLCNEDCRTEHEALRLGSGDRIVCVTAGGDRPLHLLLADVGEVVSVDANASHHQLLMLKKIALKELSYDQYAGFLGVIPMKNRLEVWKQIEEKFPEESREFWRLRLYMIHKGVLYQGKIEKWCSRVSKLAKFFLGKNIEQLFYFRHIDEQNEFLSTWNMKGLKKLWKIGLHPLLAHFFIGDPLLYRPLENGVKPSDYLFDRFQEYLKRHLVKDSHLLSVALLGKAGKDNLPPYLSRLGVALIRSRIDRLSYENKDILSYLKTQPDASVDAFSLSSTASYLDKEQFHELMKEMVRTAKHGARFCLREFLSKHEIPEDLQFSIVRDDHLEKKLEEEDRSFVYNFLVGTIRK